MLLAISQVVVGISPVGVGYGYITLSSVTGIKSRSSIRAYISGWYSAGNHLFRSELQSVRSLIWSLRDVPGMGSPVRFHWMMRSAMSMWAALCSSVVLRWRMSLTVMSNWVFSFIQVLLRRHILQLGSCLFSAACRP